MLSHVSEKTLTMNVGRGPWTRLRKSSRLLFTHVRDDSLLRNSIFIMTTTVVNSVFGFVFWLVAVVTILALPFFARDLSVLHDAFYAALFVIATVATTVGVILDNVFIAERAAGNMVIRNIISAAGKVLVVLLFMLIAGANTLNLLSAWTVASIIGLGVGTFLLMRRMKPLRPARTSILARTALRHRSRLAGNQLIGMGGALLPYVVPLLVTARLSPSDNAYFYTTWMMAGIFLIISPSVSLSLFAEGANNEHALLRKARSALGVIGAIIVPCSIGMFLFGGMVLSAFGPAYEHHGVTLLRIVLVASIPDAITNVYVAMLRVQGRLAVGAALNLCMGFGIVGLSWILLPSLGISAVGWAFLVMQSSGCVFVVVDLRRTPISVTQVGTAGPLGTVR
jgi:O-antigen/teichoic acid export membrane protein